MVCVVVDVGYFLDKVLRDFDLKFYCVGTGFWFCLFGIGGVGSGGVGGEERELGYSYSGMRRFWL